MIKIIKLDYTIESPEERKALVEKIIKESPSPPSAYLEILADYLVFCMDKQEKKQRNLLTENRLSTISKRETSFEGLAAKMENGEDGIYGMITENKGQLLQPKIEITPHDLETIPFLRQLREAIENQKKLIQRAAGTKRAYLLKKALIEMQRDQYLIKQAYTKPITTM